MQSYVITLLTCSVTMSALALFYIASTPLLAKRYSVKGRYYAWLIIVIGLIIPFRPQFSNAIVKMNIPSYTSTPVLQIVNGMPNAIAPVPYEFNISWWQIAAVIWLAGVIVFVAFHAIKHYRFVKTTTRWSESITDEQEVALFQSVKEEMGITKSIGIYHCPFVNSPMMIGLVKPRILLTTAELTRDELRFIIKHELTHYKRNDLLYKYLVLAATAIHWFNPAVYLIAKAIEILCEISCDTEIVRSTDEDTRQHYSETIVGVVKYQSKLRTALSTNFYGGKQGMKNRITSIFDTNKKRTGAIIVCIAIILTLGTGAAFAINAQAEKTGNIENTPGIANANGAYAFIEEAVNQKAMDEWITQHGTSYNAFENNNIVYFDTQEEAESHLEILYDRVDSGIKGRALYEGFEALYADIDFEAPVIGYIPHGGWVDYGSVNPPERGIPSDTIDSSLPDGYTSNVLPEEYTDRNNAPINVDSEPAALVAVNRNDESRYTPEEWAAILEKVAKGEIRFFETVEEEREWAKTLTSNSN